MHISTKNTRIKPVKKKYKKLEFNMLVLNNTHFLGHYGPCGFHQSFP